METTPSHQKSHSFTGQADEKKDDNAGCAEPESVTVDTKSDNAEENGDQSSSSNHATILPRAASSNHGSSLPRVSEEIDHFIQSLIDNSDKSNKPEVPDFVDIFSKLVESTISKYDSGNTLVKFGQNEELDSDFVQAVTRIAKLTNALGEFPSTPAFNRAGMVLQRAMSFLEEEFRMLLEDSKCSNNMKPLKSKPSFRSSDNHETDRCLLPETESDGDGDFPAFSPAVVTTMNRIATAMISAGYENECCQVYSIARRSSFKEALKKLGFENSSMDEIQRMQWDLLEGEIATWITIAKKCATVFFSGERRFCETVFSNYTSISRGLFTNLARAVVIQLLNFAEAVAMTKRSAEKLFKFLDMYETLRDLILSIDGAYVDECAHELKSELTASLNRFGEASVSIFGDLENSIKSDSAGKSQVPSGAVHPLTRYTMNYLKYACEYKDTLEQVFREHQRIEQGDDEEPVEREASNSNQNCNYNQATDHSPFSVQLMTVMELLDANLEAKSKLYRDLSLRYIFLMNNGRYILQKIKGCPEIRDLIDDNWCRRRSSELRMYHKTYQRETWGRVLGVLSHEGLQVNGKVVKTVLKERFKIFNTMFDEIHRVQSTWVVSDEQLQSELRVSISAVVIPAYRSFLGRFGHYMDPGRQTEKYVKYQPEDIETLIDDFFDGNPTSMLRRRT